MITENTVFIIGAGASKPFNYPIGLELRRQIYGSFPEQFSILYTGRGISSPENSPEVRDALDFSKAFKEAGIRSIDRYLAINQEFTEIGKMAIVLSILEVEKNPQFGDTLEDNWYFYLYNRMVDGFRTPDSYKQFGDNKVTFITFNYDRSLEYYFFECLRNSFHSVQEQELVEQLNRIPIYHVYGQVDLLPWQGGKKCYGATYYYDDVLAITPNIKTMFERSESETNKVKKSLKNASVICFLGFGYDESNMKAIGVPDMIKPGHHIIGTFKGAKQKEINDVAILLHRPNGPQLKQIQIVDCGCVDLLRGYL